MERFRYLSLITVRCESDSTLIFTATWILPVHPISARLPSDPSALTDQGPSSHNSSPCFVLRSSSWGSFVAERVSFRSLFRS